MIVVLDGALGSFAKGMVSLDMQFAAISGMGLHAHDPCCGLCDLHHPQAA